MGPTIMGRNGSLQIALDLVKLLTKDIFLIPRPTTMLVPIFISLLYISQLLFSQTYIVGPSMFMFENLDAMILHHLILLLISNIFFVVVGLLSQSRYALIGTIRALVHTISLDIFITIMYALLIFTSQSTNFHDFVLMQNTY
jgi:NADH-quinone oxidoreductase subunit H